MDDAPFKFLEEHPPAMVAQSLEGEISFIAGAALSALEATFRAKIMASMGSAQRQEVASAMSKAREMPAGMLAEIAKGLAEKLNGKTPVAALTEEPGGLDAALATLRQNAANKTWLAQSGKKSASPPPPVAKTKPKTVAAPSTADKVAAAAPPAADKVAAAKPVAADFTLPEPATGDDLLPPPPSRRESAVRNLLARAKNKRAPGAAAPAPQRAKKVDGMALAAHILRAADPSVRQMLDAEEPELYAKLRQRMFDFADLERTDTRSAALAFSGVAPKTAALALRFASDQLRARVLSAVGRRRGLIIQDEIALSAGGRANLQEIEAAQQAVINHAMELQARGQIIIDPADNTLV